MKPELLFASPKSKVSTTPSCTRRTRQLHQFATTTLQLRQYSNHAIHPLIPHPDRSHKRSLHSKTPRRASPVNSPQPTTMLSALQNPRQAAAQILNFGLILSTAFMMWKGLSVISDSPSPIVVVLSGSMEPAFQRGDLLFLWNRNYLEETKVGEIVVYNVKGKNIPIVHRLVRKFGVG
jgi:hypothetical protein